MVQTSVYIVCKYADMQVGNGLELYGSQLVKLPGSAIVSVPPYCGVPRLSHQWPVVVEVEAGTGLVVDDVKGAVVETGLEVDVIGVFVPVDVDVEVAQDTNSINDRMTPVKIVQIIPLFILPSYYLPSNFLKIELQLRKFFI